MSAKLDLNKLAVGLDRDVLPLLRDHRRADIDKLWRELKLQRETLARACPSVGARPGAENGPPTGPSPEARATSAAILRLEAQISELEGAFHQSMQAEARSVGAQAAQLIGLFHAPSSKRSEEKAAALVRAAALPVVLKARSLMEGATAETHRSLRAWIKKALAQGEDSLKHEAPYVLYAIELACDELAKRALFLKAKPTLQSVAMEKLRRSIEPLWREEILKDIGASVDAEYFMYVFATEIMQSVAYIPSVAAMFPRRFGPRDVQKLAVVYSSLIERQRQIRTSSLGVLHERHLNEIILECLEVLHYRPSKLRGALNYLGLRKGRAKRRKDSASN
ncbi:MAG: hypothetical protein RLZZ450_5908 [Pseudomonadota bacterium]|jgi:hypothetical protein